MAQAEACALEFGHLTGLSVRDPDEIVGDFVETKVSQRRRLEIGA